MEGWIKLHRKTLDNPVVCKDSDYLSVWIYLLLNATHQEYDTLFKGKRITLQKGQLITGIISISKKMKVNKDKVQRILKSFENDKQITQQTSNKNRLISIINWNEYQDIDKQNDKQVINKCKTTDKQLITNKNVKNIKNDKNDKKVNIYSENEKSKKIKEEKIHFAEFVSMTNAEYEKLISTYGKEFADQCISTLDNYKGSKGKTYKDDYRAILNWVVKRVQEDGFKPNPNAKNQEEQKEISYSCDIFTDQEYAQIMKGKMSKEEQLRIVKERTGEENV